jgi:hypothetical protein
MAAGTKWGVGPVINVDPQQVRAVAQAARRLVAGAATAQQERDRELAPWAADAGCWAAAAGAVTAAQAWQAALRQLTASVGDFGDRLDAAAERYEAAERRTGDHAVRLARRLR